MISKRVLRRAAYNASPWLATGGFFLIWEVGCRALNVPPFILPTPSAAIAALIQYRDGIWINASHTMITTLLGFGLEIGRAHV